MLYSHSHSRTLRTCLLLAALATAFAISLVLTNASAATMANPQPKAKPSTTVVAEIPAVTATATYVTLPAQWSSTTPPNPGPGNVSLTGVYVIAANDVWAVGFYENGTTGSIALHWNGSVWTNVSLPVYQNRYHLLAVSAASHNDVWLISTEHDALHWNGSTWSNHPVPATAAVYDVAAFSATDVWVTGMNYGPEGEYNDFSVYHWNGAQWALSASAPCFYTCSAYAFDPIAPDDIWTGGSASQDNNHGFLMHYDGATWSQIYDALITEAGNISAIAGTSANDVWLSTPTSFLHWDGAAWTQSPLDIQVADMVALSPGDIWAVGENSILHWNGAVWGHVPNAPSQTYLADMDAANCGDVWATGGSSNPGNHGMMLAHYSGPCPPPAPTSTPTHTPTETPTAIPTPRCAGERFTDVCPGDYFYEHVLALNDLGIISGYTTAPPCDGPAHIPCFKPYNWTTRGQIAKVVSLAAGFSEDVTGQSFEDVTSGNTFYAYIERMASRGIINGYPCGGAGEPCEPGNLPYFRPGNQVSRGQLAKMAAVAFGFTEPVSGVDFQDVPTAYTFYDYIERLAGRNIISGYPCGGDGEPCVPPNNLPYYRPGNIISRGQIAKIVNLARTQSTPSPTPTESATDTPTSASTPEATYTPTGTATSQPTATGTPTTTPTP